MSEAQQPARPYFIPEGVSFSTLPTAVQSVLTEIVEPAYRTLVLGARSELERSTAVSLVFLLTLEVFAQFELGQTLNFSGGVVTDASQRHKLMDQYLRVMNAKLHASHFLLRIKEARTRLDRLRSGDI